MTIASNARLTLRLRPSSRFAAKWRFAFCLAGITLLLSGCVKNIAYHESLPKAGGGEEPLTNLFDHVVCRNTYTSTPLPQSFCLGFVEFDDQGEMFDPQQLTNVLNYIQTHRKNLVLITYVNGWQNNASMDGGCRIYSDDETNAALDVYKQFPIGDVQKFKQFLALVANTQTIEAAHKQIMGVYLGWRGEIVKQEPFHTALYASRHNAATRMGDASDMGMALMAIQESARGRWIRASRDVAVSGTTAADSLQSDNGSSPVTVFMGHSFGAKILEQAICQWVTREYAFIMIDRQGGILQESKLQIPKFADLVLYLNPASEAIYARRLTRLLKDYGADFGSSKNPDPAFVALGSNGDVANSLAFPVGADVVDTTERLSGSYRTYHGGSNQWKLVQCTAPNTQALVNGAVSLDNAGALPSNSVAVQSAEVDPVRDALDVLNENLSHFKPGEDLSEMDFNDKQNSSVKLLKGKGATIQLSVQSPNRTRYWILKVDKYIIANHGDVWNANAMSLYARLLRLAAPERFHDDPDFNRRPLGDNENQYLHLTPLSKLDER